MYHWQCRIPQSVVHQTREPGVPGSKAGIATYFHFPPRLIQEGQFSVTGKSMCTQYWLTA